MKIRFIKIYEDTEIPKYQTTQAVGLDLRAYLKDENGFEEPLHLEPGERFPVPTGLKLEMSPDLEAQIRPRSGLSMRTSLVILNSPGTIDPDYKHEIKILVQNRGNTPLTIFHGDRIAQLVFSPIYRELSLIKDISRTGGFGSTGV